METVKEVMNSIWMIIDLIRGTFPRHRYYYIIIPFTLLRRLDCLLEPTKEKVLEAIRLNSSSLGTTDNLLCKASGYAFYNTSPYTLAHFLLEDDFHLAHGLYAYINGYSDNIRDILDKFDFYNTIQQLDEAKLLYPVVKHFSKIDLYSEKISVQLMSSIFEDLVRMLNEVENEKAGFYASSDVIQLMVTITVSKDPSITTPSRVSKVYDPCCGAGSLLSAAKTEILKINPNAQVQLYGQEIHRETFAICKSIFYMQNTDGRDAENIYFGSTLSNDKLPNERYDYIYANPPFGMNWRSDEYAIRQETHRGFTGRFGAGLPRISDAQFLFLQHALSRMKVPGEGESHVAIIMSGSPLFIGDAGSGESEIRRWILENDWLEAIIALPEQLFYYTSIATYIWILTNRKTEQRKGKVQLINATDLWVPLLKSAGEKRRYISDEQIKLIRHVFAAFQENERSIILSNAAFGYRKVVIERPLRLNFQVSNERIARLQQQKEFSRIAGSQARNIDERRPEPLHGNKFQEAILKMLGALSPDVVKNRTAFEEQIDEAIKASGLSISTPLRTAIISALSERDETAEICRQKNGGPEPDPLLREVVNIPYHRDDPDEICFSHNCKLVVGKSVHEFFKKNILPDAPEAWISEALRDYRDGRIGLVGYEIDFSTYISRMQQYRIQEQTRKLGIKPAPLSDFVIAINFASTTSSSGFEEYPNTIYLPLRTLSNVITTLSPHTSNKPSNYAQIVLDPDRAIASYVAQFFNQEIGRLIRNQMMAGSHKTRLLKSKIAQLPLYLPERDTQAKTIEVDTRITNIMSELKALQDLAWTRPPKLQQVITSINAFKREERLSDWLDSLPFPLASILWLYNTLGEDYKRKYETLLHFFEALAEFMATLLLSGFILEEDLFREKCQQLRETLPHGSLEKATFGTWVNIVEYLAKETRKMLHGNTESQERCTRMFKTRNRELLAMLCSKEIMPILQQTNAYRNEWRGHGGITSSRDDSDRHTLLENQLSKLRNIFSTNWERYELIRPGTSIYSSGIFDYQYERIMGSHEPFEKRQAKTDMPMDSKYLYFLATGELNPLKLLPLVKLERKACYFYNRYQRNGARFVSYHFEEDGEISESDKDINKALQMFIHNLS